jgi:hypothetical protein
MHIYIMYNSIYEYENSIRSLIKKDNKCSAHFNTEFTEMGGWQLNLLTYNPKHKKGFLLHSIPIEEYEPSQQVPLDVYKEMYNYVYNLKEMLKKEDTPYMTYKVTWWSRDENKTNTSYFDGIGFTDIMRKFYYGKDENSVTVFNTELLSQA